MAKYQSPLPLFVTVMVTQGSGVHWEYSCSPSAFHNKGWASSLITLGMYNLDIIGMKEVSPLPLYFVGVK